MTRKVPTDELTVESITQQGNLIAEFQRMGLEVVPRSTVARLFTLEVRPTLLERMLEGQRSDVQLQGIRSRITSGQDGDFTIGEDDSIRYRGRLCVPDQSELREKIFTEAYRTPYTVHPGGTKNVQGSKANVLVAKIEGRCDSLCSALLGVSAGQS